MSENNESNKRKLTTKLLRDRYGVCDQTLYRWVRTGVLPAPMRINGRKYWSEAEVEERDRERVAS